MFLDFLFRSTQTLDTFSSLPLALSSLPCENIHISPGSTLYLFPFSLFISSVSTLYFHFKFIFVPFFALYFFCVNFIFLFQLYIFPVSIMFLLVLLNNPLVAALYFQLSISSVSFLYFFRFNFVFIPFKLYISFI